MRSLVEELDGVLQEPLGILELRAVPGIWINDQLGVREVLNHVLGIDCGDHDIVDTVDDQGRLGDFTQMSEWLFQVERRDKGHVRRDLRLHQLRRDRRT